MAPSYGTKLSHASLAALSGPQQLLRILMHGRVMPFRTIVKLAPAVPLSLAEADAVAVLAKVAVVVHGNFVLRSRFCSNVHGPYLAAARDYILLLFAQSPDMRVARGKAHTG